MRSILLALLAVLVMGCDSDPYGLKENRNLDALNDADPFGCEFDEDCESFSCNRETGRCNP